MALDIERVEIGGEGAGGMLDAKARRGAPVEWRRLLPYLGAAAALLLFAGAMVLLHRYVAAYRPSDVRRALRGIAGWQLAAALGFAAANYFILTLYDVQALAHLGRRLPYRRVALASFTAYSFSHALGFGSLIGASVRYRLYTPLGLKAGEVAEIAAFVTVTFMTGLAVIFPAVAVLNPGALEEIGIPAEIGIAGGLAVLLVTAIYVGLGGWLRRPVRIFGYLLDLPLPGTALGKIALSVADLAVVAAVLYACLPQSGSVDYPHVLAVFVLAFVAGFISHVPGGLGVFDTVVLIGLSSRLAPHQILAGLLLFRVVYQLLPLLLAGGLFGAFEAAAARRHLARATENIVSWASPVVPMVAAGCTFLGGVVLLFSNAAPIDPARLRLVAPVLTLPVLEAAHLLGSVVGILLLLLSHALLQRLRWAWRLAVAMFGIGAVALLLKGFAWEEAVALGALFLILLPAEREFAQDRPLAAEHYTPGWIVAVAVVLASAFWLGLFSYKHLDQAQELWSRFAVTSNAARFIRASVAVALIALAAAAWHALRAWREHSTPGR